ncbi:RING finger protein unk isoform X2 [Rhodnius prolixus]|uniref:RING finger protein unk isoform X2 n=1 Tax=Rhodnius prolixus TaxID=13249 RepID=UPI003D18C655
MQLDKMPSESKPLLTAQTEKPNHYSYLKEFRVEQCSLFLQHKCTQHRPFTCFHWHFMNQRRRRPVRKRDGSFNYSPDNYCTKYDETSGICPDGDECPFLHRTAGDTERRYHLRYYKTCMCVHDTDARGFCVKNGAHCAFAHGGHDLRPPVYDIKEIQALENPDGDNAPNGPNVLDKERNLMNEDPKWQDTNYVLSSYKTEQCKRPPRLCRQGYACPQYHNSRDKRRSPRKYKYRSTPCPNVKHGDEWGEPSNCENGDNCGYCHTRTEQQFHPEIYKSTKCNDVQTAGYCPRGVFCAFAHIDQEMSIARELAAPLELGTTNLADLVSSVLPRKRNKKSSESSNGSGDLSECASTSSIGSNGSHSRAPGAQLSHSRNENHINSFNHTSQSDTQLQDLLRDQLLTIENNSLLSDNEKSQDKQNLFMALSMSSQHSNSLMPAVSSLHYDSLDVMGNALEDLEESLGLVGIDRDFESDSPTISSTISAGLASSGMLGTSAPVNIPRSGHNSCLGSFSPTRASPLHHLQSGFLSASRFSHPDALDSSLLNHGGSNHANSGTTKLGSLTNNSLYDYGISPSNRNPLGNSPLVARLREEVAGNRNKLATCEERFSQARGACEAWQREAEEANRKATIAEQQRDEAMSQAKALQKEVDLLQGSPYLHGLRRVSELKSLPLTTLKSIQAQLRSDLEQVDKELYLQTATKCMVCEERNRTVTLGPCNHYVLCSTCAPSQKDCPYCQTPIIAHSTPTTTALHA